MGHAMGGNRIGLQVLFDPFLSYGGGNGKGNGRGEGKGGAVGEHSRNSKFSYVSPRSIYGETSNEGKESASTYPCRLLSGSVQENGVDGVVLVVIQSPEILVPNGRHLCVQHTYSPMMSPMP